MNLKYAAFFFLFLNSASAYFLNEEECLNYTVYPVQYELTIFPHIYKDGSSYIDCDIIITIIANSPNVRHIELDAKELEIILDSIKVVSSNEVNILSDLQPYEYDRSRGKLSLYLKEDLEMYSLRQTQYFIKMMYRKVLKNEEEGIFVVTYEDRGIQKSAIFTRLSPNNAKYFFPCFENPQFEAVFRFKVFTPARDSRHHYCNTSLVIADELRREGQKDNTIMIQYIPSPQVGVHQVGFHYSDFNSIKTTAAHTNDTLIIWAKDANFHNYTYILNLGQTIFNVIHEYSNTNRPIVNGPINIVAVPSKIGHYEISSWNLLTIGDLRLSYSPQYTSVRQKEVMSFLLTRQLCRIWLGNPGEYERTRWKEPWFKEGMATFLGYHFLSLSGQSYWDMNVYGSQFRHKAMAIDHHHETPSLNSFNRTLDINLPARYAPLFTDKTAALLWMMENWLGSDRFHATLSKYISTRRGKFISVEDFTRFLQLQTTDCEFLNGYTTADVLNSWFTQPGYPVVKVFVHRNEQEEDIVNLKIKRFTFDNKPGRIHKYLIPISYETQYTKNCYNCFQRKFTVDHTDYTFKETLSGGWIILNRNASGFYRVNYDTETWKLIIKTLKSSDRNKIDALSRAQIMNDAFALYMSGDITPELAFEILSCLEYEESFVVWDAAISGFQLLKIDGAVNRLSKQEYEEWKSFMRDMVSIMYRRMYHSISRDDPTRAFRSLIIEFACFIGHSACLKNLEITLPQVIKHSSSYEADTRQTCYYFLLNNSREYNYVRPNNRFEKEDYDIAEKLMREETRFKFKLPNENLRPMPLIKSTTTTSTIKPYLKPVPPSSVCCRNPQTSSSLALETSFLYIALSILTIVNF